MKLSQEKVWDIIAVKWNKYKIVPATIVIKFLSRKKGKILDLGCGSGRNFVKTKGTIYGIDFSKKILRYAKAKAEQLKIKVILKKSEATKLPFKDNSFDSAVCVAVLHCIGPRKKREKTLKELYRVLKKDGEALITVWSRNQDRLKNKPKEGFIPWTVEGKKYQRYTYIFNKTEFETLLKEIGFEIVKLWENENILAIVKK